MRPRSAPTTWAVIAELTSGLSAPQFAAADTPFSRSGPKLPSYGTHVQGKQMTIPGGPQQSTGELLLLADHGDDRLAVGASGARAVNKIRTLLEQQEPVSELRLEPATNR